MGGGVLLYFLLQYGLDLHAHVQKSPARKACFDRVMLGLSAAAGRVTGARLSGAG